MSPPAEAGEPAVRTPICAQVDLEFPIFAFSHCRDVVAAVSRAGGYGVLGALAYTPDQLEIELNWIDEHVEGKPYGVDIVMPAKYVGKGGGTEASITVRDFTVLFSVLYARTIRGVDDIKGSKVRFSIRTVR